jgi:hypothetical protein
MRRTLPIIVALLALVVAACGGGDSLAENLTERAIEQAGGGNVDVDFDENGDDFEVNVQTDEGSMTIGGGEIPDGLTVPLPDGGDVQSSITMNNDLTVSLAWPTSEYEPLVSYYDDWTGGEAQEFDRSSSTFETDDGVFRTTTWYSSDRNISIVVADCYSTSGELDSACVNISQSE